MTPRKQWDTNTGFIAVTRRFCKKISLYFTLFAGFYTPFDLLAGEIVATTPPLAGLVKMLDHESGVSCLLKAGSDPHHFQLSPKQVEEVATASLLIRSSRDDGSWLKLNSNTETIDLWTERSHAWLTPDAVRETLPRLATKLIEANPDKELLIKRNLKLALHHIDEVDRELSDAITSLQSSGTLMQHPSWKRTFETYGIATLLVLESSQHGHEHGPRHLDEAIEMLKQHPDALLIGDIRHSNRSLEWLSSRESGRRIIYLDALGNCGDDWASLMRDNIKSLKKP